MRRLAQPSHRTGQVLRAEHERIEPLDFHDLIQFGQKLHGLDLRDDEHVAIGLLRDTPAVQPSILRRPARPESARPHAADNGMRRQSPRLLSPNTSRQNDPLGTGIEHALDPADVVGRDPHDRRATTGPRRDQMTDHRLDRHGVVFQVDPDEIDTGGDGFGDGGIGERDTGPQNAISPAKFVAHPLDVGADQDDYNPASRSFESPNSGSSSPMRSMSDRYRLHSFRRSLPEFM